MSTQIDKFTVGTEDELKSVNMRHANIRVSDINYENPDEIPVIDTDVEQEQGNYSYLKREQIGLYNLIANKIDEAIDDQMNNNEVTSPNGSTFGTSDQSVEDENPIETIMKTYPNTGIETLKMSVNSVIDDTLKFNNDEITQAILSHINNQLGQ